MHGTTFRHHLIASCESMQPYEFINKEWIVSFAARRVYRIAAYLSIMLFLLWCYTLFEGVPRAYLPFTRLLVFAGVLGLELCSSEWNIFCSVSTSHIHLNSWPGFASCFSLC